MSQKRVVTERQKIRRAVSDLYRAAGCSCCRDNDGWEDATQRLGKLLRIPKYADGSGYDFYKTSTKGSL